jgi:hypothetical protein
MSTVAAAMAAIRLVMDPSLAASGVEASPDHAVGWPDA